MKLLFLLGFTMCFLLKAPAQDFSLYQFHHFTLKKDTLPYRMLLPADYNKNKKYPLLIFLHGAGERGRDNKSQLLHGAKFFLTDSIRSKYPAIIVFPQCMPESYWSNVYKKDTSYLPEKYIFNTDSKPTTAMRLLQRLVKQLLKAYPVERKQVYAGGLSMGGMGTFELVYRNPSLFAAAFPICGGADTGYVPKLVKTHWWIFHGAKDDVVMPHFSERIAIKLQAGHADVKYTLYPDAFHNSWDNALAEPMLLPWLFSKKK